jgi:putative ABC transport system substrate-binding protein
MMPTRLVLEGTCMRRRDFVITLLGSATTWPYMARAQPSALPVVGILGARSPASDAHLIAALRDGLAETGFVDGGNVRLELRWAEGDYGQYPALAKSLISLHPAVIVATGTSNAVRAVRMAMPTTPIVFAIGVDPVATGLAASLNRPGDNLTGISMNANALLGKQMELLCEFIPQDFVIAALLNEANTAVASIARAELEASAEKIGRKLTFASAATQTDLESAFMTFRRERAGGVIVVLDAFFTERRQKIVELAAQNAIPAIYSPREFVEAGGLMSYGANRIDGYRKAGVYVGRILKGEQAGNLPVQLPTKFELVINLKTAKTLNLSIPPALLATADEVIE